MTTRPSRSRRDQRGLSISVEAAVVLPAIVLFIGLLISLARLALADQHIGAAAAAGARAASLERSSTQARSAASDAVDAALRRRDVACNVTTVEIDTAQASRPVGQYGVVSVRLTCAVRLSDVTLPFMPGSLDVSAERTSPVDPLRGK